MTNRYTNVPKSDNKPENVVIIRGGGDLASGTIHRLYRCGYRLLVLECEKPTAIRRMVSFCEAVYDGQSSVEGVLCRKVDSVEECEAVWKAGEIPLMADTEGTVLKKYRPAALIDAILAKKNLGTTREMADLTVGLGPGFVAGEDVDYVVETMRGHNLARIITKGAAMPNTGVPGIIGGFGKERVLHAPAAGGNPLYLKDCRYRGEGSGPCLDRRYTCQGFSYRSFAWHDQRWIYSAEGDENCRY